MSGSFDLRQAQLQLYSAQSTYLNSMKNLINKKYELELIINESFKMKRKSVLLFLLISIYSCSIDNKKNNQILDENSSIEILENSKKEKTSMLEKIQDELIIINELLDKKNNLTNTISVSRLIIKPEALNHFIDFQGTVKSDKNIIVFPEMNGILKHIYVKEGQKVKKGQLLAESSNEVLKIKLEQLT